MDQNENYQYKFQYSLANYHSIQSQKKQSITIQKDQQIILRRSKQLIDFKCFSNRQTQSYIMTIFLHYLQLYGQVAIRLYNICYTIYENVQKNTNGGRFIKNHQEALQNQRQKLLENITSLSTIFYNQKQLYNKIIVLCTSSSIYKILTLDKKFQKLEFQDVFHTVYWEITGKHSTSSIYNKILRETFIVANFNDYLINKASIKIYKNPPPQMKQSLTQGTFLCDNVQNFNVMQSLRFQNPQAGIKDIKNRQEFMFSKNIKRKNQINVNSNKQNCKYSFNSIENQVNQCKKNEHKDKSIDKGQGQEQNALFNFKKDRTTFFQNYSKSKSSKKFITDSSSNNKNVPNSDLSSKKLTFASYLEQKKLKF